MPTIGEVRERLHTFRKRDKKKFDTFVKKVLSPGVPVFMMRGAIFDRIVDGFLEKSNKKKLSDFLLKIERYFSTGIAPSTDEKGEEEIVRDRWDEIRMMRGKPGTMPAQKLFETFPTLINNKTIRELIKYFNVPERQLDLIMIKPVNLAPNENGAARENIITINSNLDEEDARTVVVHEFTHVAQYLSGQTNIYTPEIADIIIKGYPDVANYINKGELQAFISQVDYMHDSLGYSYNDIKKKFTEKKILQTDQPGVTIEASFPPELIEKVVDKIEETRKAVFSNLKFSKKPLEKKIVGNYTFEESPKGMRIEWKGRPIFVGALKLSVDDFIKNEIDKVIFWAIDKEWKREKTVAHLHDILGTKTYDDYISNAITKLPAEKSTILKDDPFESELAPEYFRGVWDFTYRFSFFGNIEEQHINLLNYVQMTKRTLPHTEIVKDPNVIIEDLHKRHILEYAIEKFRTLVGTTPPTIESVKEGAKKIEALINLSKFGEEIKNQFYTIVQQYISETYYRPTVTPEETSEKQKEHEELRKYFEGGEFLPHGQGRV